MKLKQVTQALERMTPGGKRRLAKSLKVMANEFEILGHYINAAYPKSLWHAAEHLAVMREPYKTEAKRILGKRVVTALRYELKRGGKQWGRPPRKRRVI